MAGCGMPGCTLPILRHWWTGSSLSAGVGAGEKPCVGGGNVSVV